MTTPMLTIAGKSYAIAELAWNPRNRWVVEAYGVPAPMDHGTLEIDGRRIATLCVTHIEFDRGYLIPERFTAEDLIAYVRRTGVVGDESLDYAIERVTT